MSRAGLALFVSMALVIAVVAGYLSTRYIAHNSERLSERVQSQTWLSRAIEAERERDQCLATLPRDEEAACFVCARAMR